MPIVNGESQIKRLPIKVQFKLAKYLYDEKNSFEWEFPTEEIDDNLEILESCRFFGFTDKKVTLQDVLYISTFIELNEEKIKNNISEDLELPTLQLYQFFYSWDESRLVTLEYMDTIDTYQEGYVKNLAKYNAFELGDWGVYEGEELDEETETVETNFDSFRIFRTREHPGYDNINESFSVSTKLKKVTDLVKGLDNQSLKKLKKIIDSKLKIS